jgi:hypothetical protein
MAFITVIDPLALEDVQRAIDFYDEKRVGLGEKFNTAFDKHIAALSINPFYQLRYKDYRALPIKKFPYLILFYIVESSQTVYIVSVFNTSQDTDKRPD